MAIHTFVGPKDPADWSITQIRIRNKSGALVTLNRGDSADIDPADLDDFSVRFKFEAGAGHPADPVENPSAGPAGAAGPTGPQGATGPAGPAGIIWRGAWSSATSYAIGDGVTWSGSSFVATAAIASGGTNPRVNANWLMISQGGGEIAYAENTTNALLSPVPPAADTDLPGLQITVPANSGPIALEARVAMCQIGTNAGVVAGEVVVVELTIVDEAGLMVAQDQWMHVVPLATSGKNVRRPMNAKRRLPNNASAKTYKAQAYVNTNNSGHETTSMWSGPGNETPNNSRTNFDFTPAFIQARSL